MLISFEVENFRSIYARQGISFVASKLKDPEEGLIASAVLKDGPLVPVALLYGPNAAGKTTFVKAIDAMAATVRYSHSKGGPDTIIPTWNPFRLNPEAKDKPTTFECHFILNEVRYNYGFDLHQKYVGGEWLYAYPKGKARKLFERSGAEFSFGKHLSGRNSSIQELTRLNSLFLSCAAQNNHEILTPIYEFFNSIQVELSLSMSSTAAERRIKNEHKWVIDSEVISFLGKIKTGVTGYRVKESQITDEEVEINRKLGLAIESVLKDVVSDFEIGNLDPEKKVIELSHKTEGEDQFLPINLESAGTLRLLSALPKVFGTLQSGGVLVIDELDLSLHTHAASLLVQLFSDHATNTNGAQILATTHDTNLLNTKCLRRDQVWFVEKSSSGATEIYPLTDIHTRSTDDIEKGYLQGRFGATPIE